MFNVLVVGKTVRQGKEYINGLVGKDVVYKNANIYRTRNMKFIFTDLEGIEHKPKRSLTINHVVITGDITLRVYNDHIHPLMTKDAGVKIID